MARLLYQKIICCHQ